MKGHRKLSRARVSEWKSLGCRFRQICTALEIFRPANLAVSYAKPRDKAPLLHGWWLAELAGRPSRKCPGSLFACYISKNTCTETRTKIQWMTYAYIYIYTYKTTLRVIRMLCGGAGGVESMDFVLESAGPIRARWHPWSNEVLLRSSVEISYWDDLLRSAVEIICWDQRLRFYVEVSCWDYLLKSTVEIISWDYLLSSTVEILCGGQLLRFSVKIHDIICYDYMLSSTVVIICWDWDDLLRSAVEITCWDQLLRFTVEMSCWD